MSRPTKNFAISEFKCQGKSCCGGSAPIHSLLLFILQQIRNNYNQPIIINSGYRCNVHNASVVRNPDSEHTKGLAADVTYPRGVSKAEFGVIARKEIAKYRQGGGAVILYDTHAHIDIRHDGPYFKDKRTEAK